MDEATVRRRYRLGLQNLTWDYLPLFDTWRIYDNSDRDLRLVAAAEVDDYRRWRHLVSSGGSPGRTLTTR